MKVVSQTRQFAKDPKRMRKRGKDLERIKEVVSELAQGNTLGPRFRDHALLGEWKDCRDCHIEPDWALIYSTDDENLRLIRTGTHSDLFE